MRPCFCIALSLTLTDISYLRRVIVAVFFDCQNHEATSALLVNFGASGISIERLSNFVALIDSFSRLLIPYVSLTCRSDDNAFKCGFNE